MIATVSSLGMLGIIFVGLLVFGMVKGRGAKCGPRRAGGGLFRMMVIGGLIVGGIMFIRAKNGGWNEERDVASARQSLSQYPDPYDGWDKKVFGSRSSDSVRERGDVVRIRREAEEISDEVRRDAEEHAEEIRAKVEDTVRRFVEKYSRRDPPQTAVKATPVPPPPESAPLATPTPKQVSRDTIARALTGRAPVVETPTVAPKTPATETPAPPAAVAADPAPVAPAVPKRPVAAAEGSDAQAPATVLARAQDPPEPTRPAVVRSQSPRPVVSSHSGFGVDESGRPTWVTDINLGRPEKVDRIKISSEKFATQAAAEEDLSHEMINEVNTYIDSYLGPSARHKVRITPDYVSDYVVRDKYTEQVESSVGQMWQVHALLEFDNRVKSDLRRRARSDEIKDRLGLAGASGAFLLGIVGTIFGYLKLDTQTRGYYTGRLRVLAATVILGLSAAMAWALGEANLL